MYKIHKYLTNRRAVSPILATILIIGLVVAAGATLFIIVLPLISNDENPPLTIESGTPLDYNNDGRVDAILLFVKNIGITTGEINEVSLENWLLAPGYKGLEIEKQAKLPVLIITSLKSSQIDINSEIEIGLGKTTDSYEISTITLTNLQVPAPVTVEAIAGSDPVQGEIITFETGEGLPVSFPPTATDENGEVKAYLMPNWYKANTNSGKESSLFHRVLNSSVIINIDIVNREILYVKVIENDGTPVIGIRVYDADTDQNELGQFMDTNASGLTRFVEIDGTYLFKVEYLSLNYWSSAITVPGANGSVITIRLSGDSLIGKAVFGDTDVGNGRLIRLYTSNKVYMGKYDYTNSTSHFEYMSVPSGLYLLRLDYQNNYYWSRVISTSDPDLIVDFGGGNLNTQVLAGGSPLPNGVLTRLFRADYVSAGRYDYLNSTGWAEYGGTPGGDYRLRIDWLGQYVFTEVFTHNGSPQYLDIGGGNLNAQVLAGGSPLPNGVLTRLFSADNVSTGRYDYLNGTGFAEYGSIFDGDYRLRIDWLGQYVFTEVFTHDGSPQYLDIGGGRMDVQVLAGGSPLPNGVLTRLFNANNVSTGRYDYLNGTGFAEYGAIFDGDYRLRIDWLGQYVFTEVFTHDGSPQYLDIGGGPMNIQVLAGGSPLPNGVLTRLFSADNVSSGRYDYLNSTGFAEYGAIFEGEYRLRVDWLGQYVFTEVFTHDGSPKYLDIGGGRMDIQILAGGSPLPNGVLTRLYSADNVSAGQYDYLNNTGFAEYGAIFEGEYRLRIDWLGGYYWTTNFTHDGTPQYLDINGGILNIKVTINGEKLPTGVLTRLYRADNVSTGRYDYLNSTGFAEYGAIPASEFRLRIDWLNEYYWTEEFTHNGSTSYNLTLPGVASLTIRVSDTTISNYLGVNQRVYLYHVNTDNSLTNTGISRYTNSTGHIEILSLPIGNYTIRWNSRYSVSFVVTDTAVIIYDIVIPDPSAY